MPCHDTCPPPAGTVKIYTLDDPDTGQPRYVGQTIQPLTMRLRSHRSRAKARKNRPCCRWLRLLASRGKVPRIALLEEVAVADKADAEAFWMEYLRFCGVVLLNVAPAGAGGGFQRVVRWTALTDARLGKQADAVVAAALGVTRKAISYRRAKLGIPASHDKSRMRPPPNMGGWNAVELPAVIVGQLGTKPDSMLAQEAGVSKGLITRRRNDLGIPSFAAQTGCDGKYRTGNYPARWLT